MHLLESQQPHNKHARRHATSCTRGALALYFLIFPLLRCPDARQQKTPSRVQILTDNHERIPSLRDDIVLQVGRRRRCGALHPDCCLRTGRSWF